MSNDLINNLQKIKILEKLQLKENGRDFIKNPQGIPLGEFEENDDEIIIYDLRGCSLGRYSKSENITSYMNGAPIGYGNMLITLLR